jgi:flagellin
MPGIKIKEEYIMIINHNMASLNTYRQLSSNNAATAKSLEKLSSGLRINRAGDDAAGLAISEKMRGQIRGLDQAGRNAQDGISLVQTAEGALNETHSILQRMRELAVQGATDTNTAEDRVTIQDEMTQLGEEIQRISAQTEFNTKKLINGSMGAAVATSVTGVIENTMNAAMVGAATIGQFVDSAGNSLQIQNGDTFTATWSVNGTQATSTFTVGAASTMTNVMAGLATGTIGSMISTAGVIDITAAASGTAGQINGFSIEVSRAGVRLEAASNAFSNYSVSTQAADIRADGSADFQIGANQSQTINLAINDMSAATLGVRNLQVGTQSQAATAISVIDQATTTVSTERSKLGSVQNRLEHTANNLSTSSENLTAAESRVRDVDMAKEMMQFQKNNILSQAATAMLAQANQQPQGVLQLLR